MKLLIKNEIFIKNSKMITNDNKIYIIQSALNIAKSSAQNYSGCELIHIFADEKSYPGVHFNRDDFLPAHLQENDELDDEFYDFFILIVRMWENSFEVNPSNLKYFDENSKFNFELFNFNTKEIMKKRYEELVEEHGSPEDEDSDDEDDEECARWIIIEDFYYSQVCHNFILKLESFLEEFQPKVDENNNLDELLQYEAKLEEELAKLELKKKKIKKKLKKLRESKNAT